MNKRPVYDILHQMKKLAICLNNTRSRFDKIVHVTMFLALQRLGIPKPIIVIMIHTIKKLEHTIHTYFGNSTSTYGGTGWPSPPHEIIQGNGAFPIILVETSSVWFFALKEKIMMKLFEHPSLK